MHGGNAPHPFDSFRPINFPAIFLTIQCHIGVLFGFYFVGLHAGIMRLYRNSSGIFHPLQRAERMELALPLTSAPAPLLVRQKEGERLLSVRSPLNDDEECSQFETGKSLVPEGLADGKDKDCNNE